MAAGLPGEVALLQWQTFSRPPTTAVEARARVLRHTTCRLEDHRSSLKVVREEVLVATHHHLTGATYRLRGVVAPLAAPTASRQTCRLPLPGAACPLRGVAAASHTPAPTRTSRRPGAAAAMKRLGRHPEACVSAFLALSHRPQEALDRPRRLGQPRLPVVAPLSIQPLGLHHLEAQMMGQARMRRGDSVRRRCCEKMVPLRQPWGEGV
mmetsp:Transcript_72414/g.172587  ORF Transcript_72414/g.172587 Transcript_72414/m.172587 type:complete len:209 (+) Transcript_72414:366-992(+)